MKKKIAGVLTTVLAASLLVGGNHPVTVQVDNMISGTQDDEDTQSDEADAGTIRIGGKERPVPIVKSMFLKLDKDHICYILKCLHNTEKKKE